MVLYDVSGELLPGQDLSPGPSGGYSRDHRSDLLQIVYGLLCNAQGVPVAIEVFRGQDRRSQDGSEPDQEAQGALGPGACGAGWGDRGMITQTRIDEDVEPAHLDYLTALRGPAIEKLVRGQGDHPKPVRRAEPGRDQPSRLSRRTPGGLLQSLYPRRSVRSSGGELLELTDRKLREAHRACIRKVKPLRGKGPIGVEVGKAPRGPTAWPSTTRWRDRRDGLHVAAQAGSHPA